MEQMCTQVNTTLRSQKFLIQNCFINAFFDDVGIGTHTPEEHMKVLETLFKVCQENQIRIKLSKCDFLKSELEYLGFHIAQGIFSPSQSKIQGILKFKIQNLKDLRSFLGAANFYRRHIKNFTFSSAPLTEKLKKRSHGHGERRSKRHSRNCVTSWQAPTKSESHTQPERFCSSQTPQTLEVEPQSSNGNHKIPRIFHHKRSRLLV